MDGWAWDQLGPWLQVRAGLAVGALFCVLRDPPAAARVPPPESARCCEIPLGRPALGDGSRPISSATSHAVKTSREGFPLVIIQRQLGHADLGITSSYLRGIDNTESIHAIHARPHR